MDAQRFGNVVRRRCRDPTTQQMVTFTVERHEEEVDKLKAFLRNETGKEYHHIPDSSLHEGGSVDAADPPPPKRSFNEWSR